MNSKSRSNSPMRQQLQGPIKSVHFHDKSFMKEIETTNDLLINLNRNLMADSKSDQNHIISIRNERQRTLDPSLPKKNNL